MANTYPAGSLVQVANYSGSLATPTGGFRSNSGALSDPTAIILKYRPGTLAAVITVTYPTAPIVKDGVGLYHAWLDTTTVSLTPIDEWEYEWFGTGAIQAAAKNFFEVTSGL
jgi:hypothetical protein